MSNNIYHLQNLSNLEKDSLVNFNKSDTLVKKTEELIFEYRRLLKDVVSSTKNY